MSRSPQPTRATKTISVHDLIEGQDYLKARRCIFVLAPKLWATYRDSSIKGWTFSRLRKWERSKIPVVSGIYTLLIQPNVARHSKCSYLMYIGQAVNLKKRFGEYLNGEQLATGRPKIFRLLNIYEHYVWFGYARVTRSRLDNLEKALIKTHLPPCNDKLPASIAKAAKPF